MATKTNKRKTADDKTVQHNDAVQPKVGDLRVWWVPNFPGKAWQFAVPDAVTGAALLDHLAFVDKIVFPENSNRMTHQRRQGEYFQRYGHRLDPVVRKAVEKYIARNLLTDCYAVESNAGGIEQFDNYGNGETNWFDFYEDDIGEAIDNFLTVHLSQDVERPLNITDAKTHYERWTKGVT